MPDRVAVICDSVACLPREMLDKYRIRVLPINFFHGGRLYRDGVDITPAEAYQLFLKDPDSFKTSAISPGECLETFRQAAGEANNILCITLSSRLSAVFSVASGAAGQLRTESPGVRVEVLDSGTVAAAEGFVVLAAARAAAANRTLEEAIGEAEKVKERVSLTAVMDTVRYVYRTGRIPKVAARVGSMLNIRPLFTVEAGVPRFLGAVRSKERGVERLISVMRAKIGTKPVHMAVMHAYALPEAERLKGVVAREFDCIELWVCEFSPIMGYSAGAGTLGCAYYTEG